jgi:hypothetical protein
MGEVSAWDSLTEEGEIKGQQRTLIHLGRKKFGRADEAAEAALRSISDTDRLDRMADAILQVDSWQELLRTP